MTNWWDDPVYDYAPMHYARQDNGPVERLHSQVEYDETEKVWKVFKVRVFVGRRVHA